jgi:hypothetical protein
MGKSEVIFETEDIHEYEPIARVGMDLENCES